MGAPEKKVEDYLRRQCKKYDLLCYKWLSAHNGVPDDIVVGKSKIVFVECKALPHGKLSELQKRTISTLQEHGATVYVVYTKEDVDKVIQDLLKGD